MLIILIVILINIHLKTILNIKEIFNHTKMRFQQLKQYYF